MVTGSNKNLNFPAVFLIYFQLFESFQKVKEKEDYQITGCQDIRETIARRDTFSEPSAYFNLIGFQLKKYENRFC